MSQRNKSLERSYDRAILETLRYRSIFKARVSYHQLCTYFVWPDTHKQGKFDGKTFDNRLKALVRAHKVSLKNGKYYLKGKQTGSWELHAGYSTELMKEAKKIAEVLKRIKWIKLLAVTGSVAAYNAKKKDDIDFFIVTEEKRLWLTRLFVVLFLKTLGKYRTDEDFHGKICPNIYLTEDNLEWEKEKQNIYTAHEVLLMHPLIDRDQTYLKFLKKNSWVLAYFPFYTVEIPKRFRSSTTYKSALIDGMEEGARRLQISYMRKKRTTETVNKRFIHFNKLDHSEKVLKEMEG